MKIVLVIDTYNGGNGGCIATQRLAEGLKARGHTVSIVATGTGGENFYSVKGAYLPFVRESQEKMEFLFGLPEKTVFEKAFADADIVQIQFPFYLGYGAAKTARAMNKPIIGAFHVQPYNIVSGLGKESKLLESVLFAFFKFFLFKRVPVIQCPSQFAADLLKNSGINCHLEVVSNGIPTDYIPKQYPRPEWFNDNLVLMSVGRHAFEKRQLLMIEGVKRSRYADKIKLVLCGRGEMTEQLITKGKELPVQPMIQYVTHEEKLHYLNTADLFLHASVVDLESLSCLEAIGCGLPCLIADSPHSAAPQFSLDHRFSFKHDNADNLADKINYWYENRGQLLSIREQIKTMSEQYRFEKCLDKMEALYRKTIDNTFDRKTSPHSNQQ